MPKQAADFAVFAGPGRVALHPAKTMPLFGKLRQEPGLPCLLAGWTMPAFRGRRGAPVLRFSGSHSRNAFSPSVSAGTVACRAFARRPAAGRLPPVHMYFFLTMKHLLGRPNRIWSRVSQSKITGHDILLRMPDTIFDMFRLFSHRDTGHAEYPF